MPRLPVATVGQCGDDIHTTVEMLGRKWNSRLLHALGLGLQRFTDLKQAAPGISDTVLTARLKELEREGLITRHVTPTTPVAIRYAVTPQGRDLLDTLLPVDAYARRWGA